MLKRAYRLPANVSFKSPHIISDQSAILKSQSNGLPYNRFGFIVSKRIAKSAVSRNRIKRKVRACVESFSERISAGHDFLFIARAGILEKNDRDYCLTIYALLKKGGYL